jgi:hypothetical protein
MANEWKVGIVIDEKRWVAGVFERSNFEEMMMVCG